MDIPQITPPSKKFKAKKASKPKEFMPKCRSGAYSILLALYEAEQQDIYPGYLLKKEVISRAQYHCDSSFTVTSSNSNLYTCWASVGQLTKKEFVKAYSNPRKYALTDKGRDLTLKLILKYKHFNNINQGNENISNTNSTNNSNNSIQSNLDMVSHYSESVLITSDSEIESLYLSEENSRHPDASQFNGILQPEDYQIVLVFDKHEQSFSPRKSSKYNKYKFTSNLNEELIKNGITTKIASLSIGDFLWIAKSDDIELVLPYIIERKRLDDLSHSIIDGRYKEQKSRLAKTGFKVIYLIEMCSINKTAVSNEGLMNAAASTHIKDNFIIKFTNDHFATIQYLIMFTKMLQHKYKFKVLCSGENQSHENLGEFKSFQREFSKSFQISIQQMFAIQLLQIPRVSSQEVQAIIDEYPTLSDLICKYKELSDEEGEHLLENIVYCPKGRKIGPVISKTIHILYKIPQII